MSSENQAVNDKTEIKLNPITGELDLVSKFNPDRIVTSEYNAAGTINMAYDITSGVHIEMGPQIVFDNNGNVIVIGR